MGVLLFTSTKILLQSKSADWAEATLFTDNAVGQGFDVIVNCTGADNDLTATSDPLLSTLLASGHRTQRAATARAFAGEA